MSYQVGFIGTGNMGGALASAVAKTGASILLTNRTKAKAEALAEQLHCDVGTNEEAAAQCRFLFLGVKPQMLKEVLLTLKPTLENRQDRVILVSMAAGTTISTIRETVSCSVVRIMPNMPVALGEGVVLMSGDETVTEAELTELENLLRPSGLVIRMPEDKIDAGCAVSGCGPAFAYMFLEALTDGGVTCGLPYAQALELAAQTMIGAAQMALHSQKHPGQLRSEVCSPAGSTIAGVRALEEHGFRAAGMDAVISAFNRTKKLAHK